MLKKRFYILLTAVALMATSCSNPENDKKEKTAEDGKKEETVYYSGELSEEQKESTHLTLNLAEKVKVDADVTDSSQYTDGMDSYFIGYMRNDKKKSISSYCKNPDIFGMSLEEFTSELADAGQCKLSDQKKKVKYNKKEGWIRVTVSYHDTDNVKRKLDFERYLTAKNTLGGIDGLLFEPEDEAHKDESKMGDYELGEEMTTVFPDYDMGDLPFGKKEEIGRGLKGLVEKMMKIELSDKYDCMPVTQNTYRMLAARFYEDGASEYVSPFQSDYYYYCFYPEINGLRWVNNSRRMSVGKEPVAEDVSYSAEVVDKQTKEVTARNLWAMPPEEQAFVYNEKGVREMRLSKIKEIKDVYKEKLEICPLETVLMNVQGQFMGKGVVLPTTIYNIELCYASAFSDPSEGKIRNVLEPCWMVEYWEEAWDGKRCTVLWVDGATGKVLSEEEVN